MPTKDRSIAQRLTLMNMLVCTVVLLLACASFIGYDLVTFRTARVNNLSTQAQMISANCITALLFNDSDSANKTLSALKADPQIISAVIYTPDGEPFAMYSRSGRDRAPTLASIPHGRHESDWIRNNEVQLARLIEFDGKTTGIVYLRSDAQALMQRLKLYAGIASVILLICLLAALGVSSIFRRSVAEPIAHLADAAREVSLSKESSLRLPQLHGYGEVSILIDSFNQMMTEIEKGKQNLQKAHDELEHRVEERTAELVAAQKEVEAYSQSVLRAKEDVERASRFKDQFLSTMSHELRTPLNAVLGFSELLTDSRYGPLTERQARYINHINASGKHLLRLINDILDLSKIEAGRLQLNLERVHVDVCCAEVCESLQPLVDKNAHQLIQNVAPGLAVNADGTRFKQMLVNLLGNAIKFTPKGGKIELVARPAGDMVQIEVRDSGPGIPPEEKQRIFEAFHRMRQSDKASEGTGLGLAITRRLVELHGGQLDVESQPGMGSCFHFTLPSVRSSEIEEDSIAGLSISSKKAAKILIIEDDPSAADLLESQLSSAGYEVVVCTQPEKAYEVATELRPAVITLDVVMLPVNGWDVLAKLKSDPRTAGIGVVMVTVMDQKSAGTLLGADEYIVKPVDKFILLAAVERCLRRRNLSQAGQSILVVEDDTATREFIVDLLSRDGYKVSAAADGTQAISKVQASRPDLVILDLILPEVSGFKLIAQWRKDSPTAGMPIFVLTNKDLTAEEKGFLHANTGALISKHEQWREELIRQIERMQHSTALLTEA
ncbi:MAG TPA: response regulator [Terracidiphilus sp.]|nr:response regulator [Terracidiphilus sp.]